MHRVEANNEGETHAVIAAPVQIMLFFLNVVMWRKIFSRGRFCQSELTGGGGEGHSTKPKGLVPFRFTPASSAPKHKQATEDNTVTRPTHNCDATRLLSPAKSNFLSDTVTEGKGKSERLFKKKLRNKCKADWVTVKTKPDSESTAESAACDLSVLALAAYLGSWGFL